MVQNLFRKVSRKSETAVFPNENRSIKYSVKSCAESNGTEILRTKFLKIVNTPRGCLLFRKYRKPFLVQGIQPENAVSFANGKFSEFQNKKILGKRLIVEFITTTQLEISIPEKHPE
jgi:hypothetical protein